MRESGRIRSTASTAAVPSPPQLQTEEVVMRMSWLSLSLSLLLAGAAACTAESAPADEAGPSALARSRGVARYVTVDHRPERYQAIALDGDGAEVARMTLDVMPTGRKLRIEGFGTWILH